MDRIGLITINELYPSGHKVIPNGFVSKQNASSMSLGENLQTCKLVSTITNSIEIYLEIRLVFVRRVESSCRVCACPFVLPVEACSAHPYTVHLEFRKHSLHAPITKVNFALHYRRMGPH